MELKTITPTKNIKVTKKAVAIGVVSIFLLITGAGIFTGNWQNNMTTEEYLIHYERMNSYGHPTGTTAMEKLNKKSLIESKQKEVEKKMGNNFNLKFFHDTILKSGDLPYYLLKEYFEEAINNELMGE